MEKVRRQLLCSAGVKQSSVALPQFCKCCQLIFQDNCHAQPVVWASNSNSRYNSTQVSNGTLTSGNDSGYSSKCTSLTHNSISRKTEFEHCGDVHVTVRMSSKKEMQFEVSALKADVTPSDKMQVPKLLVEISSKPTSKYFRRKVEVELAKAVNGTVCMDAKFKMPLDSLLGVNSITITIFKCSLISCKELGFVEIPAKYVILNINKGSNVLLSGWFDIYKMADDRKASSSLKEENKENESHSINKRPTKRQKVSESIEDLTYESIMSTKSEESEIFYQYNLTREDFSDFGFAISPKNGSIQISKVKHGSPAHKAGILMGDRLVLVNKTDVRMMAVEKVHEMIRSKERLRLTIARKLDLSYSTSCSSSCHEDASRRERRDNKAKERSDSVMRIRRENPPEESSRCPRETRRQIVNTTFTLQGEQGSYNEVPEYGHGLPNPPRPTSRASSRGKVYVKKWKMESIKELKNPNNTVYSRSHEFVIGDPSLFGSGRCETSVQLNSHATFNEYGDDDNDVFATSSKIINDSDVTSPRGLNTAKLELFEMLDDSVINSVLTADDYQSTLVDDDTSLELYKSELCIEMEDSTDAVEGETTCDRTNASDESHITNNDSIMREVEYFKCYMRKAEQVFLTNSKCMNIYIKAFTESSLPPKEFEVLFQNFQQLLVASERSLDVLFKIQSTKDMKSYTIDLAYLLENCYRSYLNGCLPAFQLLEELFTQKYFQSCLERIISTRSVKPLTSCLLLPLQHVVNLARGLEIICTFKELEDTIKFVDDINDVMIKTSTFWEEAVERIKAKITKENTINEDDEDDDDDDS